MQDVLKNKVTLAEAVNLCLEKNVHFVAFRLPGETSSTVIIQKDPEIRVVGKLNQRLPDKGFLIAPFSREHHEIWLIRPDIVLHDSVTPEQWEELNSLQSVTTKYAEVPCPPDTTKTDYIRLIEDSIKRIEAGSFEKVVLSRVKSVKGNFRPHLPAIYSALCASYNHAFVYMFHVNGQSWSGATPEPFICSHQNELKTVSLAGTRSFSQRDLDIVRWNNKELQEQEYVTRHIEKILMNYHIDTYQKSGPYVARAGNLLHLRTDFTFSADAVGNRLPSLIVSLHPTPAVCGMSTGEAMDFIQAGEKHDREYYAGFLGPVGFTDIVRLYVNLRCLKVFDDRLVLYIGGGITHDSIPEEEWEETEIKADTLLSVLNHIR
jgi:isochorismate synthase